MKAVAINGSPRAEKGYTEMLLAPFRQGMMDAGCDVETFYASHLEVKPCTCSEMYCWYDKPGECCIKDDMELLYPKLRNSEILVLATPVYIPLPGAMQNVLNRLCPLIRPLLENLEGRWRGRFHNDVRIKKIVLVSTSGWWEKGNFATVERIVEELSKDANVEYAGAVLRPHVSLVRRQGKLTQDGEAVLSAARQAGYELIKDGAMSSETLESVSRPLISEEKLRNTYNELL